MTQCGWCGAATHASPACRLQGPPAPLTGPEALRLLVPVETAIELVVQDRTATMLTEAIRTRRRLVSAQLKFGAYYGNYEAAYAELARRAADLPEAALAQLRAATASLRAAEEVYLAAVQPVATYLGFSLEERLPA